MQQPGCHTDVHKQACLSQPFKAFATKSLTLKASPTCQGGRNNNRQGIVRLRNSCTSSLTLNSLWAGRASNSSLCGFLRLRTLPLRALVPTKDYLGEGRRCTHCRQEKMLTKNVSSISFSLLIYVLYFCCVFSLLCFIALTHQSRAL